MDRCDLHSHSTSSDGTCTPTEVVRLAKEEGLKAIALTDHNTTKGLKEFMEAGKQYDIITVPGCEFTTEYHGKELHIVGLFFPEEVWPQVEDYVDMLNLSKHFSNMNLIKALRNGGFDISYEECAALTDAAEFNRAHVARVLHHKGFVTSVQEAFKTLLKEGNGYYIHAKRLNALQTVKFIKEYGGVAIFAHPFLNLHGKELEMFLKEAKAQGLDAMETHYSLFSDEQTTLAEELAKKYGLKQSGGSDFHGEAKPNIKLGIGQGNLVVPFSFYESLEAIVKGR
ncbi:MAG: PHP domain-containing protein [Erysipelotrichaceae bacterium]|nr:PHP domain-containing protein [Erysipelotrichaceae bacterium]